MKGGLSESKKMDKKTIMWIVIGILIVAVLFLTFKASAISSGAAQTAGAAVNTLSSSSSGMVGGC